MAKRDVRSEMISGAVRLLAFRGLEGTSFAEVLAAVNAPRGSVYHHFPDGKQELVGAAIDLAGSRAQTALQSTAGLPAIEVVARFIELWRSLLTVTEVRAGCAVMAVTAAAGENTDLLRHAGEIFRAWREQLQDLLIIGGLADADAPGIAAAVIAGCEGAVAIARAEGDMTAFELVAAQLLQMTASAAASG